MSKPIFGVCTLCGNEVYEDKRHRCRYKNLKDNLIHSKNIEKQQFNTLWEAQEFIKNNTWNIQDKEQIKKLLLIIWNSLANQEFEIKIDLGE